MAFFTFMIIFMGYFILYSLGDSGSLSVPSAGNCGEDTNLTCVVPDDFKVYKWYGKGETILSDELPVSSRNSDKYTEIAAELSSYKLKSIILIIHNTDIYDGGFYACDGVSLTNGQYLRHHESLNVECKATTVTHTVTSGKKLQLTVDKLYPNSPAFNVTFERQNNTIAIPGSERCVSSTKYPDYYRCVWTSDKSLNDGLYTYNLVVTTITQAEPLVGSFEITAPAFPSISNMKTFANREVVFGNESQSLTIECTSNGGYPAPTVTWYKNSVSTTVVLATISSGTIQSDGTYTVKLEHTFTPELSDDMISLICRSYYPQADSDQIESNRKSVLLYLALKPSQPTLTQTSVSSGDRVTVSCSTTGCRPAAYISWSVKGVKSIGHTRLTSNETTETFTVVSEYTKHVPAADNGRDIQCIVTHITLVNPSELTETLSLNVQFGPSSTHITGNKEVIASGSTSLTLTCTTGSSNPASDIIWKNGTNIIDSNREYTTSLGENNGTTRSQELVLYPTRYMDGDDIVCSVSNTVSQSPVIDKVKLDLKYCALIKPMFAVTVVEGNSSILNCVATSKPASTFKWYRQDQSNNILHQGNGTLERNQLSYRIDNVRRTDAAVYTCNANNGIENDDSKYVPLKVYYPPDVTVTTSNTTVKADTAILTCNPNGLPDNNYRYGKWIHTWPGHSNPLSERLGSKRLKLTDLTYEHSGIYTCSASNGIKVYGTDKEFIEGSTQMLIKSFPIITKSSEKVFAKLEEIVSFEIEYYSNTGESEVTLNKKIKGVRQEVAKYNLSKTRKITDLPVFTHIIKTTGVKATLSFIVKSKEDIGYYDVTVSNEVDSTTQLFQIVPVGPPSASYDIAVDNIQQSTARVSWQQGYRGGSVETFVIQLSTDMTQWENVETVYGGKDESVKRLYKLLTDLQHSTKYYVRMFSFNGDGISPFSSFQNFTTSPPTGSVSESIPAGTVVGGVISMLIAFVIVIVIVLLVRRKTLVNDCIRTRFQITRCFGYFSKESKENQNEQQSQQSEMVEYPQDHTYEPMEGMSNNTTEGRSNNTAEGRSNNTAEGRHSQANKYETLKRYTNNPDINIYEEVEKDAAVSSKPGYENIPKKNRMTESFRSGKKGKVDVGRAVVYENMKFGNKKTSKKQ